MESEALRKYRAGLIRYDERFHLNVDDYLPQAPKLTKAGKVAARQPQQQKRNKSWW